MLVSEVLFRCSWSELVGFVPFCPPPPNPDPDPLLHTMPRQKRVYRSRSASLIQVERIPWSGSLSKLYCWYEILLSKLNNHDEAVNLEELESCTKMTTKLETSECFGLLVNFMLSEPDSSSSMLWAHFICLCIILCLSFFSIYWTLISV
jgi:hypothetical protein